MHQPGLAKRQAAIIEAAGLEAINGEELADSIDKLLDSIGLFNARAARPGEEEQ